MKKVLLLIWLFSISTIAYEIGNSVWNDKNENWVKDIGEEGLADITIELYTEDGVKLKSTLTDKNGHYKFIVSQGDYIVKVVVPNGVKLITRNNEYRWVDRDRNDVDFGLLTKNRDVTISEVLVANASTNVDPDFKRNSDWIELHNNTNYDVDISWYTLSDDLNQPLKWDIPLGTIIPANGYLLIWADGEYDNLKALHTNFKLSDKGESVVLSDSNGNLLDSITFPKQKGDISCAKKDNKIVYMQPSPNRKNNRTYDTLTRAKKPVFSLKSGFYNGIKMLSLSQKNGGEIYYTTDGSIPTKSSKKYSNPLRIAKTTVVRAIAYEQGKLVSKIKNSTYLINEHISLPVMSIGINETYLNDNKIGIYKNYNERWRRAGSIEFIKNGKSQFSENVGIAIFGGQTRRFKQKSLAIFAKSKYGEKSIKHRLFIDKPNIKKVKSFILRNSGNDWGHTMMRDGLVHNIIKNNMDIDYQSYEPTVVFINGKYWGIQNIREKTNEDYLEANHGVDSKKVDILEAKYEVSEGSNRAYLDLIEYIKNNSLVNSITYNYVKSKIDMEEYMNYMIVELYVGNIDWLYNNIKYWREQSVNGKWRWILYDTDDSFNDVEFDSLAFALEANGPIEPNPPWATFLFRNLMENNAFKEEFIAKFISHLNLTFEPLHVADIIRRMKNKIKPEISRHFLKWGRRSPEAWELGSYDSIRELREFSDGRVKVMKNLLATHFGLEGNRKLNINLPAKGIIKVDGIILKKNYEGNYFNNTVVTLEAVEKNGEAFIEWSNGEVNKKIKLRLNSDTLITAEFQ